MKKLLSFALFALFALCHAEVEDVPCKLYVRFTYAGNEAGVGIPVLTGETEFKLVTVGSWMYDIVEFHDVVDAMKNMRSVVDTLNGALDAEYGIDTEYGVIIVEKADKLSAFSLCVAANKAEVDVALARKIKSIQEEGGNSSSEATDKEITRISNSVTTYYKEYSTSMSSLSTKVDTLKNDLAAARDTNGRRITELTAQLKELAARIPADTSGEALLQIGRVQNEVSALTKQQAVIVQAVNRLPELENHLKMMSAGGGALPFIPGQISTFSNQMSRLSIYLGNSDEEGSQPGVLNLPYVSVSSDNDSDLVTEGEDGTQQAKYLMRHLWEMGFIPWLPAEWESGGTFPSGMPSCMTALFNTRFFYDEAGSNGGVTTHAVGIDMPVEWKLATRPWTYNPASGMWENARVQFGSSMDSGTGSYTALEGDNWAACNLSSKSISIQSAAGSAAGTCYFYVGTITDGKQTGGTYYTPMIFMWE